MRLILPDGEMREAETSAIGSGISFDAVKVKKSRQRKKKKNEAALATGDDSMGGGSMGGGNVVEFLGGGADVAPVVGPPRRQRMNKAKVADGDDAMNGGNGVLEQIMQRLSAHPLPALQEPVVKLLDEGLVLHSLMSDLAGML